VRFDDRGAIIDRTQEPVGSSDANWLEATKELRQAFRETTVNRV